MSKPKMRRFHVTFVAEVWLSESLIKATTKPEWRAKFFDLDSPEQVAEHVAFNLAQGSHIDQLDGFADRKESEAKIQDFRVDYVEEDEPE